MGHDMDGDCLGEEYKGYIFRITGGNDKQGFAMKQGVMVNGRVRLLMRKRTSNYRPRRSGEAKRKSVRGCICGPDLAVIALRIEKKGEKEIEGVTDGDKPRRKGPKRASHIRKVFALKKKYDVRKYVVRREIKKKDKTFYKAPKVQRLITEKRLRRKRLEAKAKKDGFKRTKDQRAKYEKMLSQYIKEKKSLQEKEKKGGAKEEPKKQEPAKKPVVPAKPVAGKQEPAKPVVSKAPAGQKPAT